jgi:hypothetical protein
MPKLTHVCVVERALDGGDDVITVGFAGDAFVLLVLPE